MKLDPEQFTHEVKLLATVNNIQAVINTGVRVMIGVSVLAIVSVASLGFVDHYKIMSLEEWRTDTTPKVNMLWETHLKVDAQHEPMKKPGIAFQLSRQ